MPKKAKNLIGKQFEKLTVVSNGKKTHDGRSLLNCLCDCGNSTTILAFHWGEIKSCGCLVKEKNIERLKTHGYTATPTHKTWLNMKNRCLNPNATGFRHYGGRGIKMCDRWLKFSNFLADMGEKPPGLTLERINVDGDYSLKNCKWATIEEQSRNTTRNRFITFEEETRTLKDWAKINNINYSTIRHRLNSGWSVEKTLTVPARTKAKQRIAEEF